jgi:hypothetical protein
MRLDFTQGNLERPLLARSGHSVTRRCRRSACHKKTREHWLALEISTLNNLVMDEIGKNCRNFHRGESPWRKEREIFA